MYTHQPAASSTRRSETREAVVSFSSAACARAASARLKAPHSTQELAFASGWRAPSAATCRGVSSRMASGSICCATRCDSSEPRPGVYRAQAKKATFASSRSRATSLISGPLGCDARQSFQREILHHPQRNVDPVRERRGSASREQAKRPRGQARKQAFYRPGLSEDATRFDGVCGGSRLLGKLSRRARETRGFLRQRPFHELHSRQDHAA